MKEGIRFLDRQGRQVKTSPTQVMSIYKNLVKLLQQNPIPDDYFTTKSFGMLASYVVYVINPSRITGGTQQAPRPRIVIYNGYRNINKQHIKTLSTYPVNQAYNKAVNEITNFWISAWNARLS